MLLTAITGQYQAGMAQAAASTRAFSTSANMAGTRAGGMGTQMGMLTPKVLGVGAAIGTVGAVIASSAGEAIEWESAFAGVRKTVDASEGEFAALAAGFRDLSTEIPTAATELAAVGEAAGQLGVRTENILGFTKVMADLGETTNLAATEAATALARFANITGTSQEDFDRLGSVIVDLGNNFETTEAEIVEMGLRIAGAGRQIGMTEGEILGVATALSSVGVEAQAGGTAISRVMVDIASEVATAGDKLDLFAEVAGMSADQFTQAWTDTPAQALDAFVQGLGRISDEGGNVFQTLEDLELADIRVRDALLRSANAGGLLADALSTGNDAWAENIALVEEANKRYATTEARLEMARNRITDLKVTIGEAFTPAIGEAADAFSGLFETIERGAGGQASNFDRTVNLLAGALPGFNIVAAEARDRVGEFTDAQVEAQDAALAGREANIGVAASLGEVGDASGDAAGGLDGLAGAAEGTADEFETLTDRIQGTIDKQRALADPVFRIFNALNDYEDAQSDVNEAVAKHGELSDEAVEAGEQLVLALFELQSAAAADTESFAAFEARLNTWVEQGRITEEQARTIRHAIDHAREGAEEFSDDYIAELILQTAGGEFEYLDGLQARLDQLQGTYTATVTVNRVGAGGSFGGGLVEGRARGGPVHAGHVYTVGEKGPELLQMGPSGGGFVTPLSGAATSTTTDNSRRFEVQEGAIQVTTTGGDVGREVAHQLNRLALHLGG